MSIWAPDCAKQVNLTDLNTGLSKIAKALPKLQGAKIDDIDFGGKVTATKAGDGFTVTMPSSNDTKIKVNGATLNLHAYLLSVGLENANEGNDPIPFAVSAINGKFYASDCTKLTKLQSK